MPPTVLQAETGRDGIEARRLKITCHQRAISRGQQRYLTATHGQLPAQVSTTTTGEYVALQQGVMRHLALRVS